MAKSWKEYWHSQSRQIEYGLSQWRERKFARVRLQNLRETTRRSDLYRCVTVTIHGAGTGASGQQHLFTLAQAIAPLLKKGESVRICIKGNGDDYLEFSPG